MTWRLTTVPMVAQWAGLMTLGGLTGAVIAETPMTPTHDLSLLSLITPLNVSAIGIFLVHFGMTYQTFLDHRRRLMKLELWQEERASHVFASAERVLDIERRVDKLETTCERRKYPRE